MLQFPISQASFQHCFRPLRPQLSAPQEWRIFIYASSSTIRCSGSRPINFGGPICPQSSSLVTAWIYQALTVHRALSDGNTLRVEVHI
ncbi:hypothetical protein CEXT_552971 [Caerostris extrusa]|uniref:Uncharacterized protein n=1 Tax=Caerostris extrusa TaxID=172846 RepID=A0AAV4NMZ7_CAEEX|nr:hypothetical protein CEXT_552971 [Caerostris extrusa]